MKVELLVWYAWQKEALVVVLHAADSYLATVSPGLYWVLGNQLCCVLRSHDFPSTGDSEGVEYRGTDNSWVSVRSGWDAEFELQPGRSRRRWCEFWLFRPRFYPFNSIITSPSPHQVRVVDVLPRCRSEIKGRTTKNTFFFGLKLLLVRVPPPLGLCFMLSHIK